MARGLVLPKFYEVGRIRIGDSVEETSKRDGRTIRRPRKIENFRLSGQNKILLNKVAEIYGGTVERWEDGPQSGLWQVFTESNSIKVIFPSLGALSTGYEIWGNNFCTLRCNGVRIVNSAMDQFPVGSPCHCPSDDELQAEGKPIDTKERCPLITRISVILPECGVGTWRLDTHGYYASAEMRGIVEQLERMHYAESPLPCHLLLEQRSVVRKNPHGKVETRHFAVPVLTPQQSYQELLLGRGDMALRPRVALPVETETDTASKTIAQGIEAACDVYGGYHLPGTTHDGDATRVGELVIAEIYDTMRSKGLSQPQILSYISSVEVKADGLLITSWSIGALNALRRSVQKWPVRVASADDAGSAVQTETGVQEGVITDIITQDGQPDDLPY